MNIPENKKLGQFEYGSHWSEPHRGQSGWYIRLPREKWVKAKATPARNELPSNFRDAYRQAKKEQTC